ncbi:MAG: hypothetical protein RLZZ628_2422 [Bacteroidota bacterium]|jgi:hypothetical protein
MMNFYNCNELILNLLQKIHHSSFIIHPLNQLIVIRHPNQRGS